jgi:hypothetical protein
MRFKSLLVVLLVVLTSACATTGGIPVGGGWRMNIGVESNTLLATNATAYEGDISMNGGGAIPLPIGEPVLLRVGSVVRSNVFVFRAYVKQPDGQRSLVGLSTMTFHGGSGQTYEWTIRYIQPIVP